MEEGDRENSFPAEMALRVVEMQADGSRNPGMMVQDGEMLALMTWKEGRKNAMFAKGLKMYYIAIRTYASIEPTSTEPRFSALTRGVLFVGVYLFVVIRCCHYTM